MTAKNDANRYDSTDYLKAYRDDHVFPKIHDDIFALVRRYARGEPSALDLCCSTGLLGQRLIDQLKMKCVGVEGYLISSREGPEYGVTMPVVELKITPDTLAEFIDVVREHRVGMLVARRCISEIWHAPDDPFGDLFVTQLMDAGVHTVVLQGRAVSKRSVHPMKSVDEEMAAFARHMPTLYHQGQFAVLSTNNVDTGAIDWNEI